MAANPGRIRLIVFDFDGVFTDNSVFVFEDGREAVRCSRFDGLGLSRLRGLGVDMMILSTEVNPVVSARAKKLKIECVQSSEDKGADLKRIAEGRGVPLENVAYVGNDINDERCLRMVGLPITVADAHPDVRDLGAFTTKTPGGHGAVREICDWIYSNYHK